MVFLWFSYGFPMVFPLGGLVPSRGSVAPQSSRHRPHRSATLSSGGFFQIRATKEWEKRTNSTSSGASKRWEN